MEEKKICGLYMRVSPKIKLVKVLVYQSKKKVNKQEDEINDLKEKNSKLQNTINFFENLFDRLVKFIKNKMFGKEKERENYWNFSKDLYTS